MRARQKPIRARRWKLVWTVQGGLAVIIIILNVWSGGLNYNLNDTHHLAKFFTKKSRNFSSTSQFSPAYSNGTNPDGPPILTSHSSADNDLIESLNGTIRDGPPILTSDSSADNASIESLNGTIRKSFFNLFDMFSKMEPENCDDDFGFGLVSRWTKAGRTWCQPTVTCHQLRQTEHAGNGDNLCIVENATLDLQSAFNDTRQMQETVKIFRETTHFDMPYVHFQVPILSTECKKDGNEWKDDALPGWNADWMVKGLNVTARQKCQHYSSKYLLIIQRHGFANFYHSSEDFFNSLLVLLILKLKPSDLSVLISDLFPWGPYESLWKHLFPEIHTAWELKEMGPTCFGKIIISIYGPASPLTLVSQATTCYNSPLVKAYSRWVWSSFDLDYDTTRPSDGFVKLLWMSRKSSVKWPEQAYCDDRYFNCTEWQHLGVRPLGRVLKNEDVVLSALRNRTQIQVNAADFNVLPFAEQVQTVFASDVMAGPHGAGLTHLLFLPDDSCVFEVFIDGSESNLHYQNLASWRGIRYSSLVTGNPAPEQELVSSLWTACIERFLPHSAEGNRTSSKL